jgi:threonylcarbamoyladenosine tRNA methylthiotransferase MtaB
VGKLVKVKITKAGYPLNEGQFVRVLEETEEKAAI